MPSFSILRWTSKDRKQPGGDSATTSDGSENAGTNARTHEVERRGSKRELLQGFIHRSIRGGRSASSAPADASTNAKATASAPSAAGGGPIRQRWGKPGSEPAPGTTGLTSPPLSPRSTINSNKPLPSPPLPGTDGSIGSPAGSNRKPVLKLDRIMSTLSENELEKLFSGAPQFFARSEGVNTGAPNPSVAFPWDEALEIRDLTDHAQIEDEAWACVTALPHLVRSARRRSSVGSTSKTKRAHFYPKCRERPNMLSMQGLEKGTVGFAAALELSVADALQEEQYGFDCATDHRPDVIVEARQKMLTSKDGLRHMEESAIMEQLIKNGKRYVENDIKDNTLSTDLYNELFLHIIHPPTRVLDHQDPYSLSVQIQALLKVLNAPNVWVDFSQVEWRIRLGQVLWDSPAVPAAEDGVDVDGSDRDDIIEARSEQRYWLLLQILLACELWIRLDAIVAADDAGTEHIKPREIYRFQQEAKVAVKWSMLLAKSWLENIEITKTEPCKREEDNPHQQSSGWLATFTKRLSLSSDHADKGSGTGLSPGSRPSSRARVADQPAYAMRGKNGQRQVEGLTHFARRLKWPGIDAYGARISSSLRVVSERTPLNTPLASPATGDTGKSSYFGPAAATASNGSAEKRPPHIGDQIRRQLSKRRKISAALQPIGWLSKSYVSGLILPGEGLSHFLMSTLLENDGDAMARLGPMANLCGGFVYGGKSFWSTACIVGRVIAAGKGAVECMGWISSDIAPSGIANGWVDIEVSNVPGEAGHLGKQARIWGKTTVERQSSVLGDTDPSSVLPADFIIPFENVYKGSSPPALWIELKNLKFFAPVDSVHTTPTTELSATPLTQTTQTTQTTTSTRSSPEIHTYPAAVAFTVEKIDDYNDYGDGYEGEIEPAKEYTFCLSYDVYFVTAHPCVPSQHVKILKSPSSPTIQQIDLECNIDGSNNPFASKPSNPVNITGHPLHKYYTYTAIHLSELLERRDSSLDDLLDNPGPNGAHRRPSVESREHGSKTPRVLVVDCITGFQPQPQAHEIPLSPVISRTSSLNAEAWNSSPPSLRAPIINEPSPAPRIALTAEPMAAPEAGGSNSTITTSNIDTQEPHAVDPIDTLGKEGVPVGGETPESPAVKMHSETRRRQFGSDMEILVRAFCAEKGWNALISRRRRGCLACAIREAGALGWKVIIRVD